MVIYDPFWRLLEEKHMSQYRLKAEFGISSSCLQKLKKNEYVRSSLMDRLAAALGCRPAELFLFSSECPDSGHRSSLRDGGHSGRCRETGRASHPNGNSP